MRKFIAPLAILAALALAITFARAGHHEGKGVKPGAEAPAVSLMDLDGKSHSLADQKGKVVVLEWINPGCPYVERHYNLKTMSMLADANKDVTWMAIATGDTAADAAGLKGFVSKYSIGYPILLDKDGAVGKAYGATATPHMFIINKEGKIAYAGAIDSEAIAEPSAGLKDGTINHVEKALGEIKSGTSVSTPETKAYGCGVKYAK